MAGSVGRPRKHSPRRKGSTAREEILDASAELFTTQGYATTSTHQIADAVGIRQASLYYHFPSKADIFISLLKSTTEPSLAIAERLAAPSTDASPELRLWALVAAEARLLMSSRWNLGRLYQLPIAVSEEFEEFHHERHQLAAVFTDLAEEIVGAGDTRAQLPFLLSQTVTEMRPNNGTAPFDVSGHSLPEEAVMLADAALTVLGAEHPAERVEWTTRVLAEAAEQ
ncbi:TetR/AcrR family transcriptional regulator [Corynebacterium sp. 13CS0277]|uniref:TetR/AcrR family transcriptional regulator n=1 Tax=Corynebacterium sp. 13CS0277 TaxID=2071994 RepID=UPI000D038F3E|nr:TetR/AcrR family transcriptional regulator [Corynebacterium sp. 13CS0277]PRQ11030.1 TetR/AcrR family transcriptional regulator [Corynebacterium sp. 13CS0277]